MILPFLFFHLLPFVFCADCPACPPKGIWSSWTTNGTCATTCGSCSKLTRTRTCLSATSGCPCTGSATLSDYCNTQACNIPRENTGVKECCNGAAVLRENLYHCTTPEEYTLGCCPDGGYWSTWSAYTHVTDKIAWTRTRTCMSTYYQCPCVGEKTETIYECPCVAPTTLPPTDTQCQTDSTDLAECTPGDLPRPQFIVRPSLCTGYMLYESSNWRGNFMFEDGAGTDVWASKIGYVDGSGKCKYVKVFPKYVTGNTDQSKMIPSGGNIDRHEFKCDLTTLRYYYDDTFKGIEKVAQFVC